MSTFARTMATNLARCDLIWVDHNHQVTWLIYHVIALYSQKDSSSVSQCQWPLNLVGLRVRVKEPHLLSHVTCGSNDHVLFEKRHVSTNARPQNSAGDTKHIKTLKNFVFYSKDINIWFTSIYTTLKISKLWK